MYYFAAQLDALMSQKEINNRELSEYFASRVAYYAMPFQKWTSLHIFSSHFVDVTFAEDLSRALRIKYARRGECAKPWCQARPAHLLAVDLFAAHGFDSPLQHELADWVEPREGCCPPVDEATCPPIEDMWEEWVEDRQYWLFVEQIAEELFYLLFGNRSFLAKFHDRLADWMRLNNAHLASGELFRKDAGGQYVLRRVGPPEWVKRAVFFRDRGYCCSCNRDLNGDQSPLNRSQFDHIVPLALGGLNDVSNLQLLCKDCNNQKGGRTVPVGDVYERWYPIDRLPRDDPLRLV
ncbi:HNH endonuclease [Kribbella soli]|uniref:HNH endonuclease n=1 Tax=Kribbella soli TaxID=1124743 RepID=UPI0013F3BC31|nr:HNH endonuclease [Kribbella soli]